MPWMVDAKPPETWDRDHPWDFRYAFFPRKEHYKRDAEELAEEARRKGGRDVKVWKCQ